MNSYSYRYGFNGQEKENALYGESKAYDFGARMYDGRTGRFFKTEPKYISYLGLSPYTFAGNSCVVLIDKNGEFPWVTGLIGAGTSIAIGYISANLSGDDYEFKDIAKDAVVGFAIGSGAALLGTMAGITTASKVSTKILFNGTVGMGAGMVTNAFDQYYDIKNNDRTEFNGNEVILSGLVGTFAGAASAGMGKFADKFMNKINDKFFSQLNKLEIQRYIAYQSKYLKKEIELITGKKVGKRQLERELAKKVEVWKEFQEWQITGIKVVVTQSGETSGEVAVSAVGEIIQTKVEESNE